MTNIARVANEKPHRDRALMNLPGNPVCSAGSYGIATRPGFAIATLIERTCPEPAPFGLLGMSPESLLYGFNPARIATGSGTVEPLSFLDLARSWMKRSLTVSAKRRDAWVSQIDSIVTKAIIAQRLPLARQVP